MTLFSLALILFLVMDPFGNILPFQKVLGGLSETQKRTIIFREFLFALALMLGFFFLGDLILDWLNIGTVSVNLTVGLVLFLFAIKILFPSERAFRPSLKEDRGAYFVPLCVPLTAGPGLLATVMLYGHFEELRSIMLMAIALSWIAGLVVHFFGTPIQRLLGKNGLSAIESVMAMILVLLAIQRFLEGARLFVEQL